MFQITINCATAEAAITMLAKLRGAGEPAKDAPKSVEKPTTPAPGKPTVVAETKPKADVQKPKEEPSVVPYDTVSAAISAAAKTNRDATLATLVKFGAKNGKELKPEQYTEFLAALEEATSATEALG